MLRGASRTRNTIAATIVAIIILALAATALAAHPKKKAKYAGTTNAPALNGFSPPVTFSTNAKGTSITGFSYASVGCSGGIGGLGKGNPWKGTFLIHRVGTIKVAKSGTFSVKNVKVTFTSKTGDDKTITTSSVKGKFVSATKASGTITYKQQFVIPHEPGSKCTGDPLSFSAKVK
jgi:hypothetical protein